MMDEPSPFPSLRELKLLDDEEASQDDKDRIWKLLYSWQSTVNESISFQRRAIEAQNDTLKFVEDALKVHQLLIDQYETRIMALEQSLAVMAPRNSSVEVTMRPSLSGDKLPRWFVYWGGRAMGSYVSEEMARERAQEIRDEIDLEQRR